MHLSQIPGMFDLFFSSLCDLENGETKGGGWSCG